jgi:hypothetical protein
MEMIISVVQSVPFSSLAATAATEEFGSNGSDQLFRKTAGREGSGPDAAVWHEGTVTNVSRLRSDSGAHLASEQSGVAFVGFKPFNPAVTFCSFIRNPYSRKVNHHELPFSCHHIRWILALVIVNSSNS